MLGEAIGRLLLMPPAISVRHIAMPRVSVAERLSHLRALLRRGGFSFDEAVRGADRMTVAVTLFALLELYKRGEADWEQPESFGEIAVRARARSEAPRDAEALAGESTPRQPAGPGAAPSRRCCSCPPTRSARPSSPTPPRPARAP